MDGNARQRQYEQGLRVIHVALIAALNQKGLRNHYVSQTKNGSGVKDTTFSVTANGQTHQLVFTSEEICDSASAIDSFANTKVRMLASHFNPTNQDD
jgi:hypothetical protein